jgi:hypothetical protein
MRTYGIIDESHAPIYVVKVQSFEPTAAEFQQHLKEVNAINSKAGVLVILDLSDAKFLSVDHRITAGNWLKNEAAMIKRNLLGMAFVNTSVLMSFVLKGIFLISRPPVDYLVTASMKDAIAWAGAKLKQDLKDATILEPLAA